MKTALLAVSFGTTHLDTLQKTIRATEEAMAAFFPQYAVYRAFTSGIVRKRLLSKHGIHVDSVEEALGRIAADGFEAVIVQPTLLIPGEEYDLLRDSVAAAAGPLRVSVGAPLLRSGDDLDQLLRILRQAYPTEEDTLLLLMGHGTAHSANDLYLQLAEKLRTDGGRMRLCTVEGSPSFADAVAELKALPQRKVLLAPLLLVAGDHAKNDMAGDEPGSLRSLLTAEGFAVTCRLQGLGELRPVRELFLHRVSEAKGALEGPAHEI